MVFQTVSPSTMVFQEIPQMPSMQPPPPLLSCAVTPLNAPLLKVRERLENVSVEVLKANEPEASPPELPTRLTLLKQSPEQADAERDTASRNTAQVAANLRLRDIGLLQP